MKYFRLTQNPFILFRWPAMGIHGDKSQQERDWVLNGKLKSTVHLCQQLTQNIFITSNLYFVHFFRVQIRKSSDPHCYRCCLQGSRSVSALIS